MSAIFGGSKSSSTGRSENRAFGQLNEAFSPLFGQATDAASQISRLLGGDASGFNAYKDATGFDFMSEQGSRGITGNAAARGLMRSGATGQALANYGNQMQNQFASQYMDRLLGLGNMGLQAGNLVGNAGQVSTEQSRRREKPGLGRFIGGAMTLASDRRTKTDIKKIGKTKDGLNLYEYKYIGYPDIHVGVMADEVEKIKPEALGPTIMGFKTVDYSKLEVA